MKLRTQVLIVINFVFIIGGFWYLSATWLPIFKWWWHLAIAVSAGMMPHIIGSFIICLFSEDKDYFDNLKTKHRSTSDAETGGAAVACASAAVVIACM